MNKRNKKIKMCQKKKKEVSREEPQVLRNIWRSSTGDVNKGD
jgi:hypothetical protein